MENSDSKFKPDKTSKKSPCRHLAECSVKKDFEEKMKKLSIEESSIEEQLLWLDKDIQQLGQFYKEFGDKYPKNRVTTLAYKLTNELWSEHHDLDHQLYKVHCEMDNCRRKLCITQEDVKKKNCQCMDIEREVKANIST